MNKKKVLCVIPAKIGSVRLPKKNFKLFLGKPIIEYPINTCLKSKIFQEVVVSSDSDLIYELAEKFNITPHKRRPELSTGKARVVDVCFKILQDLESQGKFFDLLMVVYPTNPFILEEDLFGVYNLLQKEDCNFAFSCTQFHHYPHQALWVEKSSKISHVFSEPLRKEVSSSNKKVLVDNGSIYGAEVKTFLKDKELFGVNSYGYEMPKYRSVDIDTQDDWFIAESIAKNMSEMFD